MKTEKIEEGQVVTKLHLGCGEIILKGYINCDLYNPKADLKCDVKKLPFPSNFVDEIYASHIIEHFSYFEHFEVLKEWCRVLKPGGKIRIETPDMLKSCKKFVEGSEDLRVSMYAHFFAKPWIPGEIHKFLFTERQLKTSLHDCGFENMVTVPATRYVGREDQNLGMEATKKFPLLVAEIKKEGEKKMKPGITVHVSTKGRYFTTLPLFLVSVANQTLKPTKILIYDDNTPPQDLRKHPLYQYIFGLFDSKGIAWTVGYGAGRGQVLNHQRALDEAETEFLYRGDDDTVLDPNVLEILMAKMKKGVGAVAPIVLHPNKPIHNLPKHYSHNKIEFCEDPSQLNIQWFRHTDGKVKSVDHLYSTFLYRVEASKHGYNKDLSPVGHREESLFTYEMKRNGWELLVNPNAVVNHFRYSEGGIRGSEIHTKANFDHDAKLFLNKLKEWGVELKTKKLIVIDAGLGDHLIFNKVLPEIKAKYGDLVLAVCYQEVFKETKGIDIISIHEAKMCIGEDLSAHSIYKWMWDRKWNKSLEEAIRGMYL